MGTVKAVATVVRSWKLLGLLAIAISVVVGVLAYRIPWALAQSGGAEPTALPALPSMTIVRGVPVTPTVSLSHFEGLPNHAARTDGLCQRYPGNPDICPTSGRPRAPEVKELARALRYDPNLIYEYVYNSIDTELMFGSHKGSLGTIIDQSGTPFDQAQLMVDLLRESNIPARFMFGYVTFHAAGEGTDWIGSTAGSAICDILGNGGIPTTQNCSGAMQDTQVAHIWVEAQVQPGGAWRFFDPSLKHYETTRGINTTASNGLRATAGLTTSTIGTAVTPSGASEGSGDLRTTGGFNPSGFNTLLQNAGTALLGRLDDADLQGADLTDVVGGRRIIPLTRPTGGYLQSTPSNPNGTSYTGQRTWTDIPDVYRATVKLYSTVPTAPTPTVYVNATFFADEIYGRRLELVSKQGGEEPITPTTETWTPQLILDGVRLDIGAALPGTMHQNIILQMTANHPFAAGGGTYGDATVNKQIKVLDAATLVVAWGSTSSRMVDKWGSEAVFELTSANMVSNPLGEQPEAQASGNGLRAQIAATWLAQFSWATHLHAELADAEPIILHTLGVVSQDQNLARIPEPPTEPGMEIGGEASGVSSYDEITVVDLETSFGLVSRHTTAEDVKIRRGALHAIAATGATLEGSVVAQLVDSPDAASTAARFAWGLSPEANESPSQSARPFYYLSGANPTARGVAADSFASETRFDGGATAVSPYNPLGDGFDELPDIKAPMVENMRGKLSGTVKTYALAEYDVTVSAEAFLGPGHRYGSEYGQFTYTIQHHTGGTTTQQSGSVCIPGPRNSGTGIPNQNPMQPPDYDTDWLMDFDCEVGGVYGHMELYWEVSEINSGDTITRTRTSFARLPSLQRGGALLATKYDPNNANEPIAIANVLTRYGHPTKGGGGPAVTAASDFKPNEAAQSLKDRFVDRSSAMGVDMRKGQVGFRSPVLASVGTGEFPYRLDRIVELRGGTLGFVPAIDTNAATAPSRREGPVTNWDHSAAISNSGFEGMGQSRVEAAVPTIVAFMAMQETWGQMAKGGRRDVIGSLAADWWARRLLFNVVTVFSGGDAQQFVRLIDDSFLPTDGGAAKLVMTGDREVKRPKTPRVRDQGADQEESVNRAWKYNGVTLELTNANGDKKRFEYWGAKQYADAAYLDADHGWRMTKWSFPQGVELKVDYYALALDGYVGGYSSIPSHVGLYKSGVNPTAIGPGLDLPEIAATPSLDTASTFPCASLSVTNSENETTKVTFRRQMTRTVSQRPDLDCRPLEVFGPSDQVVPSLRYTYDSTNRVMEARDATAIRQPTRGPHQFFIADGYRGERQDPVGGRYASETLRGGRETRHYDELFFAPYGTETARPPVITRLDGRGRVLERTYPEGDKVAFTYDAVDNPTKLTQYPKPGSFLAPQEIKAFWNPTWNKPEWIEDARGNRTDFTYYGAGQTGASLLKQAKRPSAVTGGALRPTYEFEYNDIGLLSRSQDPDLVWTAFSYDALTCPTLVQIVYAAQNLKRYSRCDTYGNVAEVWDERGETQTKTTTTFDSLRRPLEVVGPLGMRARTTYDMDGRPTKVEKFYDDPAVAGVPALTDPSAWRVWKTGYTPTGQVAWTEDPDHDVALFEYDKLDRKTAAVAPTGERSEWVYDLGGQLRIVRSAVGVTCTGGIACVQDTETYAYTFNGQKASLTDARALGSTTFQYDGFDRLVKTIFPAGSTYEESTYDASGNVLTFRTREGRYIVAGYDNLDRKVWEKGLRDPTKTCLAPTPVCETEDPPEEARMRDAAFTYRLSGRMETASTDQVVKSWEYDTAGRPKKHITQVLGGAGVYFTPVPMTMTRAFEYEWDVVGNLTKLVYPEVGFEQTSGTGNATNEGGIYATYSYDYLNRMTGVTATGVNMNPALPAALVTIAYDNLSRRTQLSFGDGSSQKYYYEADDDLVQLAHDFPIGGNTSDVTFTYANDKSGRQVSETIGVNNGSTDYLYNPATVASVYDPANGLNQYPKVDTKTFTYRTDGPMTYDGVRYFAYDERRNLTLARQGALTAGNYEQDLYDALGARFYSARAATTIADTRRVELTDGLRPEVAVEEMINIPEATTNQVAAGGRFSVMGPNPDERLIWIDATAAALQVRYVHSSRRGDARILSKGGAPERKYTYSAFGESTDNVTGYPWRFTGQRFNSWTGLYHFKARAYSPALGRFMQPDPIGYEDGVNLYSYVDEDPFNFGDPKGTIRVPMGDFRGMDEANMRVHAFGGPDVANHGGQQEHFNGETAPHFHLKIRGGKADGQPEVRISLITWLPLNDEENTQMTKQMWKFLKKLTPQAKMYIAAATYDIYERGEISEETNFKGFVMATTAGDNDAPTDELVEEALKKYKMPKSVVDAIKQAMKKAGKGGRGD